MRCEIQIEFWKGCCRSKEQSKEAAAAVVVSEESLQQVPYLFLGG